MRPYIHHVFRVDNDNILTGNEFATITGKSKFKNWAVEHFKNNPDQDICFRLDSWDEGVYFKVILFPYIMGKNKGEERVVFAELCKDPEPNNCGIPL